MAERRIERFSRRWLLVVLSFAAVIVACGSGNDGRSPAPEPTATMVPTIEATATVAATPTLTALPSPTSTSVPPVALPAPLPSPTQVQSIGPQVGCQAHHHLNIELLAAQPGMEEAVITEVDDSSIRVELFETEIIIIGTGTFIRFHADLSNDQLDQVSTAVDAVRYEC